MFSGAVPQEYPYLNRSFQFGPVCSISKYKYLSDSGFSADRTHFIVNISARIFSEKLILHGKRRQPNTNDRQQPLML
jgi:hypothetical protein